LISTRIRDVTLGPPKPASGAEEDHRPEFPALYQAADRASHGGQDLSVRLRAAQLLLLLLAAFLGALAIEVGGLRWGGLLASIAFAVAGLIEAMMLTLQPDKAWYQGRAVAESVKSLAWRYAVGGRPFGESDLAVRSADSVLAERIQQILADFETIRILPLTGVVHEITDWMGHLRAASLADRKAAYQSDRIENQRLWYSTKARWNESRSVAWSFALLIVQTLGVVGGVLYGTGKINFDLLGVMAAIAAAAVAWLQVKQHSTLTQSYAHAAHELSMIRTLIPTIHSESDWARFVDNAETAISREHMAWRAKRE
jgi:conflict system pore-forming effector with SLATT domain